MTIFGRLPPTRFADWRWPSRMILAGGLPRTEFCDKLVQTLEEVPGYESGDVGSALIESAWAEYTQPHRGVTHRRVST